MSFIPIKKEEEVLWLINGGRQFIFTFPGILGKKENSKGFK